MGRSQKIYVTSGDSEVFLLFSILLIVVFVFISIVGLSEIFRTKNYIKIDATVTSKYDESDLEHRESSIVYHYIKFNYNYKGIQYENKLEISFLNFKKVNDKITVYINPEKPGEVRNDYRIYSSLRWGIFVLLFLCITLKAFFAKKTEEKIRGVSKISRGKC